MTHSYLPTARRPLRILLVEDDPIHARIIRRAIAESNTPESVQHVTDGSPALDILLHRGAAAMDSPASYPDIVLLDLQLPNTNGFEVLRAVKSDAKIHHVPIVVISSSDLPGDVAQSYALGANAYIVKPGDFNTFVHHMASMYEFWGQVVQMPLE